MLQVQFQGKAGNVQPTGSVTDAGHLAGGTGAITCTSYRQKDERSESGKVRDWRGLTQARPDSAALPPERQPSAPALQCGEK